MAQFELAQQDQLRTGPADPGLPPADHDEVATATRLVGDRWSLLVVRELACGNGRFGDIHSALPELSRSLLAARLRYLSRLGILDRRPSSVSDRRTRFTYELTPAGWGLIPVLSALDTWARTWGAPGRSDGPVSVQVLIQYLTESVDRAALPNGRVSVQFRLHDATESQVYLRVDGRGARAGIGTAESPDIVVSSSVQTLSGLYWGGRTCGGAIAQRAITFDGPSSYAQQFPEWFPNRPAVMGSRARALAGLPQSPA